MATSSGELCLPACLSCFDIGAPVGVPAIGQGSGELTFGFIFSSKLERRPVGIPAAGQLAVGVLGSRALSEMEAGATDFLADEMT